MLSNTEILPADRTFRREYKVRRKIKRWESLPPSQLIPQGRPLFCCQSCHFVNTIGKACPWCSRCCDSVTTGDLMRRRVSAPHLLNDIQKDHLCRIDKSSKRTPPTGAGVPLVDEIDTSTAEQIPEGPHGKRRKRHRDAAVYSGGGITASVYMRTDYGTRVQSIVLPPSHSVTESPTRPPFAAFVDKTLDDQRSQAGEEKHQPASPSTSESSPFRTLRRKGRLQVLKRQSSSSPRTSVTLPEARYAHKKAGNEPPAPSVARSAPAPRFSSPPMSCTRPMRTPSPTFSSSSHPGRLGCPSRPLYSMIRKNMSVPASPTVAPAHASCITAQSALPESVIDQRLSMASSCAVSYERPYPYNPFSVDPFSATGFSLSGEAELRIALARLSDESGSDSGVRSEYRYRDREVKRKASVMIKVKKLGRGLKDLVQWRP